MQGASDVGTVQGASAAGDVLRIADMLTLTHQPASAQSSSASLTLEWEGGPVGDMLADAITAVILQVLAPTAPLYLPPFKHLPADDRALCLASKLCVRTDHALTAA